MSNIVETILEAHAAIGDRSPSIVVVTLGSSNSSFFNTLESSADFLGGVGFMIGDECWREVIVDAPTECSKAEDGELWVTHALISYGLEGPKGV